MRRGSGHFPRHSDLQYFKAEDLRPLLLGCMSYFMSDLLASIRNEMRWGQLAAKDSYSLPCSPKAKLSLRFHVPEMPQSPGSMPSRPDRIQFSVSILNTILHYVILYHYFILYQFHVCNTIYISPQVRANVGSGFVTS